MTSLNHSRVLLIGERWSRRFSAKFLSLAYSDPATWLELSVRLGAFADRRSTQRLGALGITLNKSASNRGGSDNGARAMNLLPPAAQAGEWDWELANYVGDALYDEICRESYDLIMLCGRAVATALGISTKYPFLTRLGMHDKSRCVDQDGRCRRERRWYALDDLERAVSGPEVLLLPHPSGLNRWWNDEVNILLAQDAVARSLCSARQRSKGQ